MHECHVQAAKRGTRLEKRSKSAPQASIHWLLGSKAFPNDFIIPPRQHSHRARSRFAPVILAHQQEKSRKLCVVLIDHVETLMRCKSLQSTRESKYRHIVGLDGG
jgi:hypothetical protein